MRELRRENHLRTTQSDPFRRELHQVSGGIGKPLSPALIKVGLFIVPAFFALVVDLVTKSMAFSYFDTHKTSIELIEGFLYFSRAHNTGIAFGMLQGHNSWLGILIALMAIGIPCYAYSQRSEGKLFVFSIGVVYGGALGNLYDRWMISYVRDFIDVRFGSYHYPVFNGADTFICVGVALLFLQSWLSTRKAQ